jgi:hypothetical protein
MGTGSAHLRIGTQKVSNTIGFSLPIAQLENVEGSELNDVSIAVRTG